MINPSARDLPSSGTIKLSEVKAEFGKGNNLLGYLGEGGVTSSAPLKLTDFYGTAASDAVSSENFGNGYLIGLHGYVNQGTSGSLDQDIIDEGPNLRTGADTYAHRWPLSFDGQPHAFTAEYPSIAKNWDGNTSKPEIYSNALPVWHPNRVSMNQYCKQRRRNYLTGRAELSFLSYGAHKGYNVTPLQRLKKGTYTISGTILDSVEANATQWFSKVKGSILQFETMTPISATMAQAGGATIKNQLASIQGGSSSSTPYSLTVDIQYEWTFLQIWVETDGNNYGTCNQAITVESITRK
jgi:hypothetical protein